ncbi:4-diphosphocytidyl-2-C-methyl-D-erythritol kinase [Desulfocapsa sulfexigens DSM 10523]|uniref:4-diphosphocytidyl-2-C-methyl-D-erythritol kinase n=1 Tax=Desulfocapsa sulfexigens (strain DSM 10523 / SB164P1) TaxID=1167006 RepID=M1PRR2_DESSD|nr:4-(cytidine 5'-diphospho)-2-C-methyl-D-erythritol kinase [Desulfocapsa sulfexigens]AGF79031.1 4-diphosphocytidyl-2-C-methyl-D-erythritol kinase [Desulfocapsa sulfexigens DSM 10523]
MKGFTETVVIKPPAKVNLSLHIIGKRSDGYHDLDSVMQKIDLTDTLTLSRCDEPGVQLYCPGSDVPEDESNLVWKAALLFLKEAGLEDSCGVSIVLEKNIPIAAGLGGGSSDAGCLLTAMNRLLQAGFSQEVLLRLAKSLGADVPFFVVPHSAVRATGIGDRMKEQESLRDCSLLLVNPGFSVSTAWVYENYTLTRMDKDSRLSDPREKGSRSGFVYPLHNDLEAVTIKRYPEIETIKRFMLDNGASSALMSGSGPTVFGVFPDLIDAENDRLHKCAAEFKRKYGKGVFVTRPVINGV